MEQRRRGKGTEFREGVAEPCANEYLFFLAKWTAYTSQVLQNSSGSLEVDNGGHFKDLYGEGKHRGNWSVEQVMERPRRGDGMCEGAKRPSRGGMMKSLSHPPCTQLGEVRTGGLQIQAAASVLLGCRERLLNVFPTEC